MDIAIVGGGISGITTAFLLQRYKKRRERAQHHFAGKTVEVGWLYLYNQR